MMLEDRSLHIPDISEEQRVKFSKYPLQWGHCTHRPQRTVTGTAHICNKAPVNKYCTCSNMDWTEKRRLHNRAVHENSSTHQFIAPKMAK